MLVAFISECEVFSSILIRSLQHHYPNLSFEHFTRPEAFLNKPTNVFPYLIFKLTDQEKFDTQLTSIRRNHSDICIIGLKLGKNYKTIKGLGNCFNYLFTDSEIESKLTLFFARELNQKTALDFTLNIDELKRKYIQLEHEKSRCLALICQNKTAAQIAIEMNKSQRTIEKHIVFLRHHFGVKRKNDLIALCKSIQGK